MTPDESESNDSGTAAAQSSEPKSPIFYYEAKGVILLPNVEPPEATSKGELFAKLGLGR